LMNRLDSWFERSVLTSSSTIVRTHTYSYTNSQRENFLSRCKQIIST
jgi:hypothetical protein